MVIVVQEVVDVDDVVDVEDCFINSKDAHFIGDKMGVFLSRPTYNSRTRDVAMYCYTYLLVVLLVESSSKTFRISKSIEFSRCYLVDVLNRFFFVSVGRRRRFET